MRTFFTLVIAVLALATTGCTGDQTSLMAQSCQDLLAQDDSSGTQRFIRAAEERIASLNEPQNKLTTFVRDLQDPDALTHKKALEQCLWQLKARES